MNKGIGSSPRASPGERPGAGMGALYGHTAHPMHGRREGGRFTREALRILTELGNYKMAGSQKLGVSHVCDIGKYISENVQSQWRNDYK